MFLHSRRRLRKTMKIPVFHDDQHWTAHYFRRGAVANALEVAGKPIDKAKVVLNGRAPQELRARNTMCGWEWKRENITLCETRRGVVR